MGENSKIQWTDHTFNPWRGCTKVAAGCANCYAETLSKRNPGTLGIWGPNGTRVLASEAMWRDPVRWNRDAELAYKNWPYGGGENKGEYHRPRVFCASLADVFEDWPGRLVDSQGRLIHDELLNQDFTLDDARSRLFRLWRATLNLDYLVLTKRIENVRRMLDGHHENLWLGTSIANQEDADRNIPELLKCRDLAAKLFLSIEPLIGPVMLHHWIDESGAFRHSQGVDVDWVIVGGESGPNARPCNVDWIRSIVRQCQAAGVPPLVKQVGAQPIESDGNGFVRHAMLRDKKGGDPSEWPEDLRVREFPAKGGE